LSFFASSFVFGCSTFERAHHAQAILAGELGQHDLHRTAIHLAVDLLREVTRLGSERTATTHPDRAADGAGTRLTGALLAPRLDAAAAHLGLGLLRLRAGTASIAISRDDLVNQRLVEGARKRGVGGIHLAGLRTRIQEFAVS
jgi:hypothetical protein